MNKTERLTLEALKVLIEGYTSEKIEMIVKINEALNPTARKLPYVDSLKDKKIRKERVRKIEKELDKLEKMDTQLHNKSKVEKK